jgi:secreted trypsin-like serine protease
MLATTLAVAAVFHGTPVPPAEVPWFVSLTARGPFCGGALIAPDRVLTAAHCVQGEGPDGFNVRVGGRNRDFRGTYFPTNYREIPSAVDPLTPGSNGTANDVAVIVLRRPVTGVPTLPIAATPPADGETTLTVGRGSTGPQQGASDQILSATQQVVPAATCQATYGPELHDPAVHLCTQDATSNGAQACAGDSGSPLLVRRDGVLQVAGVVTWGGETLGRDCGEGPADASERVLAHLALVTGTAPRTLAPYAERRVRVRRSGKVRRCVIGAWHPGKPRFSVRWWRRDGAQRRFISGTRRTRTVRSGRIGCTVIARTAGGWAEEQSYNAL